MLSLLLMACSTAGTKMPISVPLNSRFFILGCLLLALSAAAKSLDFPGSFSCLDDEILIRKPKGIRLSNWQHIHVVDSAGVQIPDCVHLVDGKILTVPYKCTESEMGRPLLYIVFSKGRDTVQYKIICKDVQADEDGAEEPSMNCGPHSMSVKVSRQLVGFHDEVLAAPLPSSWSLQIKDGTDLIQLNTNQARQRGYIMTSDNQYLMIQAYYNASGIKEFTRERQKVYVADIRLILRKNTATITVANPMICVGGSPSCNATHLTIVIPPFGSELLSVAFNDVNIPVGSYAQEGDGVAVDSRNGLRDGYRIYIDRSVLEPSKNFIKVTFNYDGTNVPVLINASADCPGKSVCTPDGYMEVEVAETKTKPKLNLTTVRLRDGSCKPSRATQNSLLFRVPLNACGTSVRSVGNKLLYENEIHALWKDFPPRRISRDSEYRLTVYCFYDVTGDKNISINIVTHPPFASSKNDGPLSLILNLYPDGSYGSPYSDIQYPVVKTLREPIYLEVQVLNRNDPNIELVLDDCWATMSSNPHDLPQWNVVVDGCQEERDNVQTVFHPVGSNVAQPSHRKRFEVKTFAFVLRGEASTGLVYFHCSAIVCNKLDPDFPLCSKTCQRTRKRRDEPLSHKDSSLASLPGPLLFVDSKTSKQNKDDTTRDPIAIVVLPVLCVMMVLTVVLLLVSKRRPKTTAR